MGLFYFAGGDGSLQLFQPEIALPLNNWPYQNLNFQITGLCQLACLQAVTLLHKREDSFPKLNKNNQNKNMFKLITLCIFYY